MLNNNPFFSIVIPVYNVEQYVGECLNSLISQTFDDLEIICVIDGSTDKSKEICDSYAFIDQRIKIIYQENQGVSAARNKGLYCALGKYVHFVDPDDRIHDKDVYGRLYQELYKRKIDVVVAGSVYYTDIFDKKMEFGKIEHKKKQNSNSFEFILENKYFFALTSGVNKIFRRDFLVNNNILWPLNVTNEDDRWLPLVMNNCREILFLPIYIYDVRRRSGSLTSIKSKDWLKKRGKGYMDTAKINCNLIEKSSLSNIAKSNGILYYMQLYFCGLKQYRDNGGVDFGDITIMNYMKYVKNKKMKAIYFISKILGKKFAFDIMKRRYKIE